MKRSMHSLNHYRLLTMSMGQIVPVGVVEVLPGDTFRHGCSALMRFSPLVTPVMHPVGVKVHHWFVPTRLVEPDWEGFITGSDSEAALSTVTQDGNSDLLDHMGVDPVSASGVDVWAAPVRAYNKIVNEFYLDQDLDTPRDEDDLDLAYARWEKDYFTTARPAPQQGAAVQIPFSAGTQAPISGIGVVSSTSNWSSRVIRETGGVQDTITGAQAGEGTSGAQIIVEEDPENSGYPAIYADLSQVEGGGIDVTDFRVAMALQRYAEARSRFGQRYVDWLRYYGIRPSDGRLDRPEYLGGGKQTVSFSEVLATAEGTSTVVGQLAGHGISAIRSRPYRRFFEEHGFVISVMIVRPRAIYGQSLNRYWLRAAKEDFWTRELEIVGQQAVTNQELYPAHASPDGTFGWVDRYLEYRGQPSFVSGAFRTDAYDEWHLARIFASDPALNSSFVECVPADRIFAAPSEPHLQVMAQHFIKAARLVSRRART